ncbi:conserved hypothetical protein [Neospora caninum Liverpool]|uniref:Uncharacterized protein n=1 Tax=Neospora caninum (strain Liverpool) TaxID=572307 RepID=F0VHJ8_NEOCL|nr:conserved hypothetical protein [Neospora caninum Liverpool]CBZ53192.1 conserved hypothetical protein [Neospora caninum Liverpool]CEL67182.1 TPA: hypothetical protein BN1204_029800 [Neospora caninum Liverpool]|eukprot:XP_003883224.1 conserved hypothetical protein [Neospora caninum Liverpool]
MAGSYFAVRAGSRVLGATTNASKVSYLARQSSLPSPVTVPALASLRVFAPSSPAFFCSLSRTRFAANAVQSHSAGSHAPAATVTPRYTDDIPAEYYKYGIFKNYRRDDSPLRSLLRLSITTALLLLVVFLNHHASCSHWHYKHRITGSYLDSDSE